MSNQTNEGSLKRGQKLKTILGNTVTIKDFLAEGGQAEIYTVDFKGQKKALKWYKKNEAQENLQARYNIVKEEVRAGSPGSEFLWPIDLTEWKNGTFGHIIELRPEGYYDIADFLSLNKRFGSFKSVTDAALALTTACSELHNKGYCFLNLNDGSFLIEPLSGKVLVGDDDVLPTGSKTNVLGKPRYMAPENIFGKAETDIYSDRFSLSVIIFMLFCLSHPLEGKKYLFVPILTPEIQERMYGSEALFIMDPNDTSNGPHSALQAKTIKAWNSLPDYMRELFLKAFGKKALEVPASRPTEQEWINALTRFRGDIVACECGNEVFTKDGQSTVCDGCGKLLEVPYKLELGNYSLPAVEGNEILRCQLGSCDAKEALNPVASMVPVKIGSSVLAIQNLSSEVWEGTTPFGMAINVAPDEVVPLTDGMELKVFGETLKVSKNGNI